MNYGIETTYSPDDGGYYSTVFDKKTGKERYVTGVVEAERDSFAAAAAWISRQLTIDSLGLGPMG